MVASSSTPQGTGERPNIIYVMADDMGWGDPGCYGATKIPTPHMDRLAGEGVRCTDAHSSSAVCTPSRYGALTGRYCWRTSLKRWVLMGLSPPLLSPERVTVASFLREHGYATAAVGKWHLGLGWPTRDGAEPQPDASNVDFEQPLTGGPNTVGFDYFFGISASLDMPPYCFIENDRTVGVPSLEKDPYNAQQRPGPMVPGWKDEEVDTTFADKACWFMDQHVRRHPDVPFFLWLTPSAPHRPCVPPPFTQGRSQAGARGDMVCVVDWVVGRVIETLDRLGVRDNTLLIVTSDNGARLTCHDGNDYGHKSCGDWRGQKADAWDGGHREPFIARWPGRIEPGTVCDDTICLIDLMATCADVIGEDLPDGAAPDSVSALPALLGRSEGRPAREFVIHHSGDGMFAIRQGKWKLIEGLGSGGFSEPRRPEPGPDDPPGQLYDMEADPAESRNLWAERPEIVRQLRDTLERVRQAPH